MRIESLQLERYGVFESRTVDLSGPGLIVVYGPNEAGKSTCLTAIGDFFYRIPPQSPLGGFGYDAMRIGATLSTAAGERLVLQRRKGNGRTLIDEAGVAHDDGLLSGLLGATDRERFSQLFGLDHQRLRVGGERLLAADGEIGRLIVEAGGGLRHLMGRLDSLDAEADSLFSTRRAGDRAFYKALDAFQDAEGRLREASVSRETYEAARKIRDEAEARLEALRTEQRGLVADASRLERLIRVTPLLTQLVPIEAALAGFADLAELAEDFHARWSAARRDVQDAEAKVGQARSAHGLLASRVDKLAVDPRAGAAALDIEDLGERVVLIAQQRRDRPNRQRELQDDEAKLAGLRERLKAHDAKALAERLPPEEAVEAIQRLALEATGRRGQRLLAERQIAAARDAVATLTEVIKQAVEAGHDEPWGVEAGAFASLAAQEAAVAARARQLASAQSGLARDITRLGFADLDALKALACPDGVAISAEIAAREQLEGELTNQTTSLAKARTARDSASAEIERLRQGGEVATEAALDVARTARDSAWTTIREAYRAWTPKPDPTRAAEVEGFDVRLAETDDLADRRITEAQRVAALAEAELRRSGAMAEAEAAQTASASLTERLAERRERFAAAFPDASERHVELPALAVFVSACAELLDRAGNLDAEGSDLSRQQAELQPVLDLLAATETASGCAPDLSAPLARRIKEVVGRLIAHDRDRTDLARRREELGRAEADLRAQERALVCLISEEDAWTKAWTGPLAQLGAAPGTPPEAAAALANQWAAARGVLGSIAQTRRRLERMGEDEAALMSRVERLAGDLGVAIPADALEAANSLVSYWRAQETVRSERAALEPELDNLRVSLATAEQALAEAQATIASLAVEAKIAPGEPVALDAFGMRAGQKQALVEAERGLLEQIRTAGDDSDVSQLRLQQGDRDTDGLKGDLAAVASRLAEVEAESEAAIRSAQAAKLDLESYERGGDANHALADRESATARIHAALERYVEVRLARELVAAAITRVRATQQDPLVSRAGALFSVMTEGRFSAVETDVDSKGVPVVVGRRTGGGIVSVSAMSDGVRDQLFLAFRLASLEVYCSSTEPLPFVADDILVHFDDSRSAATLELLATFAATTQVLLFTHHESVKRVADELVSVGRATVVELGRAA